MAAVKREARLLSAAGVHLRALVEGCGSPVLILHGFTGCAESMEVAARGLAAAHRTIRLDLVGHGRSDAPREIAHYSMESCVEQLGAALDALGQPRVHALGYSMGGRAALALAAWQPDRVRSLLLVGASAGIEDERARAARRGSDSALAERIERDGLERFVDHWMGLPLFASQRRLGRDWLAAARAQRLNNRPHGLANCLRGMGSGAQPPLHALLPGLRVPVQWVVGEADARFRATAEELARHVPGARVAVVPRAGHAAHLEDPVHFGQLARRFFAWAEQRAAGARAETTRHTQGVRP